MILFIDTSFNDVIIKLFKNNVIYKEEAVYGEKENSRFIMPLISKILDNEKPDEIWVVNGPGSFTGVRLGVTVAKSLAYTMNIKIKTITSLECIAISSKKKDKIVALSDNNGYYVGYFNELNEKVKEYEYLNNDEFEVLNKDNKVITDKNLDYEKLISYMETKEYINPHSVNPIYIKKIAALK